MLELVRCERCGRAVSSDAIRWVAGLRVCPACAEVGKRVARAQSVGAWEALAAPFRGFWRWLTRPPKPLPRGIPVARAAPLAPENAGAVATPRPGSGTAQRTVALCGHAFTISLELVSGQWGKGQHRLAVHSETADEDVADALTAVLMRRLRKFNVDWFDNLEFADYRKHLEMEIGKVLASSAGEDALQEEIDQGYARSAPAKSALPIVLVVSCLGCAGLLILAVVAILIIGATA